jgi:hypothetical protein
MRNHCTAGLMSSTLEEPERRIGQRRDATRASTQRLEWPGRREPPRWNAILAQLR